MEREIREAEEEMESGTEEEEESQGSTLTMEKVAAAKQFIENHYKNQRKIRQERMERLGTKPDQFIHCGLLRSLWIHSLTSDLHQQISINSESRLGDTVAKDWNPKLRSLLIGVVLGNHEMSNQ